MQIGKHRRRDMLGRVALQSLLLLLLAACAGGGQGAGRNSYVDTSGASVRALPQAPAPQHHDWMTGHYDAGGVEADVNFSEAVVSLDIGKPQPADEEALSNALARLYPDMRTALEAAQALGGFMLLPSIDLLDVSQKYSDDRVLAALELEMSTGNALYPGGLQAWLGDLLAALPAGEAQPARDARAYLATAIRLGGGEAPLDPATDGIAAGIRSRFLADRNASTVIGFYTQSAPLEMIFQRDRLLQARFGNPLAGKGYLSGGPAAEQAMLAEIDKALSGSIALRDAYNDYLTLHGIITNPAAGGSLNDLSSQPESGIAIFPHAGSLEEQLFGRMPLNYPGTPMDYLREQLQNGSAQLAPGPDSGWYSWQQFALEPLLLPERADEYPKLAIRPAYLLRLDNAFQATITQRRETHAKDLPGLEAAGESDVSLARRPLLNLEPAPTLYLRTMRAYGRLSRALREQLLRRPENGSEQLDWLLGELDSAQRRFAALHCLSCNDIGQRLGLSPAELDELPAASQDAQAPSAEQLAAQTEICCVAHDPQYNETQQTQIRRLCAEAAQWLAEFGNSTDSATAFLAYDPRVCVPATVQDGVIHNWGVIGVRLLLLESSFQTLPQAAGGDPATQQWLDAHYAQGSRSLIPVYEYAGFDTRAPISREQFRSWCNQSRSKQEFMLVANAYGGSVGKSWLERYGYWIVLLICLGLLRDRLFPGIFGRKAAVQRASDEAGQDEPPAAG